MSNHDNIKSTWEKEMDILWLNNPPTFKEQKEFIRSLLNDTINNNKLIFVDKDNWPVEGIIGHVFITFLRRLIHTRKIMRYKTWLKKGGCKIYFKN